MIAINYPHIAKEAGQPARLTEARAHPGGHDCHRLLGLWVLAR
jgi:hypothetical protein